MSLDKQTLCIDILVSGHVQAFVDFFYLTHRPEVEPTDDEVPEEQVGIPSAMLPLVKTQLAEAEVARRRGDTQAVFGSYKQLADFFTGLADQRTAIYFWEKCLEITQLTSDAEGEAQATRSLGMAHEASGDLLAAIKQYEQLLRLTQSTGDVTGSQQANEHLFVAYQSVAAEREGEGEPHQALEYREKCLEASRACGDASKESKAQYNLGQAHEGLADTEHLKKALGHYEQYLSLSEKAEDVEAQGSACYALAQVYQRMQVRASSSSAPCTHEDAQAAHTRAALLTAFHPLPPRRSYSHTHSPPFCVWPFLQSQDAEAALTNMQRYLQFAQSSGKLTSQAEACCALGVLYNAQNDYASAVQYLERYFELARSIGDRQLIDKARTYLGVARGNSVLPSFMNVVTNDLDALLRWKNRRTPFEAVR